MYVAHVRRIATADILLHDQVTHPEDTRNFSGGPEDMHASKSNKRYVSTGVFKDF